MFEAAGDLELSAPEGSGVCDLRYERVGAVVVEVTERIVPRGVIRYCAREGVVGFGHGVCVHDVEEQLLTVLQAEGEIEVEGGGLLHVADEAAACAGEDCAVRQGEQDILRRGVFMRSVAIGSLGGEHITLLCQGVVQHGILPYVAACRGGGCIAVLAP